MEYDIRNFSDGIGKLEEITKRMQEGGVSLQESVDNIRIATKIKEYCLMKIKALEGAIALLQKPISRDAPRDCVLPSSFEEGIEQLEKIYQTLPNKSLEELENIVKDVEVLYTFCQNKLKEAQGNIAVIYEKIDNKKEEV